ncbi:MAG: hypothetical protein RBS24_06120, partial [Bacilli bacterium]|nr:hypothetical protein [Bacilli bacterium]
MATSHCWSVNDFLAVFFGKVAMNHVFLTFLGLEDTQSLFVCLRFCVFVKLNLFTVEKANVTVHSKTSMLECLTPQ